MSQREEPRARLLEHLLDGGDDELRQQLELAALEDDDFFDELRAAEAELLESYVRGELGEAESLRLSELIGRSRRLQESAETTLALKFREHAPAQPGAPFESAPTAEASAPGATVRGGRWRDVVLAVSLMLLVLALWRIVLMHEQINGVRGEVTTLLEHQENLEVEVELLERELEKLEQEQLRWQRRWAREIAGESVEEPAGDQPGS